jgi:tetratricopeptide (TPR) repeat protein/transcriptional regulator with XRE-family HTH domain
MTHAENRIAIRSKADLAAELQRLLLARERALGKSIKKAKLARAVGVSVSSLYAYLNGTTLPATDSLDRLLDELGVAPEERRRLATARDGLDARGPASAGERPRELPGDVFGFTGRDAELAVLDRMLDGLGESRSPPVVAALTGAAGAGKTALAVRWAHRVRHRFPDGQLFADLRGYDPERPVHPGEALEGLLRSLGVAGGDIPDEVGERAARYREIVATRRILIILDNARAADQVAELLPGVSPCFVVVTSRDSLDDLAAAHRIELAPLPLADAITLLRNLIGARVAAEPAATVLLAQRCALLPLALRIAAELAVNRPAATIAQLDQDLRAHRLDLLDAGGDLRTSVRAVFSWSYASLPADVARAFRLLGLHPGDDVDANAVAALLDTDVHLAGRLLDALLRAHLVHRTRPRRYGMHDLLHAYAAEQASADKESANRAALTRLLDHYAATATAAAQLLYPRHDSTADIRFGTKGQAAAWLDAEHHNLVTAAGYAALHGWPAITVRLSRAMARHLRVRSRYTDALIVHTQAVHASASVGDRTGERHAHGRLGEIHLMMGRHDRAIEHLRQALAIAREIGDREGEHSALANLGDVHRLVSRYTAARADYRKALNIAQEMADRAGERRALAGLGDVDAVIGSTTPRSTTTNRL